MTGQAPTAPLVSVGFPVYNGAAYLAEALDALAAQTLEDFEVIICDNASTDDTEAICRSFVARDRRMRYVRHEVNRGLVGNHTFALEQATGRYFVWAHHDNRHAPAFLERCVAVMEADPTVVYVTGRALLIDEGGRSISRVPGLDVRSPAPDERLREVIGLGSHRYKGQQGFGVYRTAALKQVPVLSTHVAWDRSLLAEVSLHGRFVEVPEDLFFYRKHSQQASSSFQTRAELWAWHDPSKANRIVFPNVRLGLDYLQAVRRAPLGDAERRRCYAVVARWPLHYWKLIALDCARAGVQLRSLAGRRFRVGGRPQPTHGAGT
jgi:glycosyltransferase involved in cell wall biosynthesis